MADHYGDAELTYGDFRNRLPADVRETVHAATKWRVELLQFHWHDHAAQACEYLLMKTGTVGIVSNQVQFSLIDCEKYGIKLLAHGCFCGGFISPKWLDQPTPELYSETRPLTPSTKEGLGGQETRQGDLTNKHRSTLEKLNVFKFGFDKDDMATINRASLGISGQRTKAVLESLGDCGNEYRATS
ncbi:aldo/keto reductase/Endoribonuclease L-PSP [Diaporthe helianthi]|uniref:Aldo/keto reductase/Endoribonuclease L-PSP n=1 Tax=Diaporthe helianthi TaxID=158607 RepID=A0A2P5HHK7_DIAHE|nr:aldo/keto reductase/Endoribonuclease L-PSP [Diaporthe helianthi]